MARLYGVYRKIGRDVARNISTVRTVMVETWCTASLHRWQNLLLAKTAPLLINPVFLPRKFPPMKTIFELTRISTNSKTRYPIRKTQTDTLGLFSTLEKAQKQMLKDVTMRQKYEQKRLKDIAKDEEYRKEEKRFGHDIVLAYSITEHQLDVGLHGDDIQSVRTYTADGKSNDENLLDRQCKRHFKGRTPDQIRFHPGDIVEVITNWQAELCVVWHAQSTVEDYERNRSYWLENHKKRCLEKGIEYKEEECFHWDYSDDCYLVYSLGEGNTHFHPESSEVFFPTKPVPKALQIKF